MLFDLAQTSRVSPRKSERLYASCDLRKSPLSASKKDVPNYQKEMCSLSCFCHSDQSRLLRKEVRIFSLGARECTAYVLHSQHLEARDNHLALSDLRGFTAKITASLVTRFKGH
jgi:hypothetical protein